MEALGDPELLAEAKKLDIPIVPMDGETLAKRENEALTSRRGRVAHRSVMNVEVKTARDDRARRRRRRRQAHPLYGCRAPVEVKISGSRTTVTLDDKPADRARSAVGMTCDIEYQPEGEHEAVSVGCRSKP
jgi:hypothetical protein